MPTPFNFATVAVTGSKVVAALQLPPGKTTAAGTQVSGGQVPGTTNVPNGSTEVYFALTETPAGSGVFKVRGGSVLGSADLPPTTGDPYMVEARVVAAGTTMTDYADIAAKFALSTDVAYAPDVPPTINDGILRSGTWYSAADVRNEALNARLLSDGLDALSDAVPTGAPSGVLAKLMWLVQRSLRAEKTSSTITVKKSDGSTATTQPITSDGTNETVGSPA